MKHYGRSEGMNMLLKPRGYRGHHRCHTQRARYDDCH